MLKSKTPKVKQPTASMTAKRREMSEDEELHENIREKKKDEDVYDPHSLEELKEDDEISTWEEGFMEGAHAEGEGAKCRTCGKVLVDGAVEEEFHGEVCRFCSDKCAEEYSEHHEDEEEE